MVNYKDEQQQVEAFQELTEKATKKASSFFQKAFQDMKASAKAQHEVDKANFEAAKTETKANFEENRFHNTFAKARTAAAKERYDAAKKN